MSSLPGSGDGAQDVDREAFLAPATLEVVNALGMHLSVAVDGVEDAYAKMRAYGSAGWSPTGGVPRPRGWRFPYEMHDRFDWRLIGARRFIGKDDDGNDVPTVVHLGEFYKERVFEEQVKGKKLPAAVKYSRGARDTDPPDIVETSGGEFKYVTLIQFRGAGKAVEEFCVPRRSDREDREERARVEAEAAKAREDARQAREAAEAAAKANPLPQVDGPVQHATHAEVAGLFRQLGMVDTPAKVRWAQETLALDLRGKLTPEQVDLVRDRLEGMLAVRAERERLATR